VSRLVTASQFEDIRRLWMDIYVPMSVKQAEMWRSDWLAALAELHYLEVLRVQQAAGWDSTVRIRLDLTGSVPLEGVRGDLETLWNDNMSEGLEAAHAFSGDAVLRMTCIGLDASKTVFLANLELRT
jgi:hypothetical protein